MAGASSTAPPPAPGTTPAKCTSPPPPPRDFKVITGINLRFTQHSVAEPAHKQINVLCGDEIPNHKRTHVDETTEDVVKDATASVPLLVDVIADEMTSSAAVEMDDWSKIKPFATAATLSVEVNGGQGLHSQRRLNKKTLTEAPVIAWNHNQPHGVIVYMGISHMHFEPGAPHAFTDWEEF